MAQSKKLILGEILSTDPDTGALLVEIANDSLSIEGGNSDAVVVDVDDSTPVAVKQEAVIADGDWTLLRTVSGDDGAWPATSVLTAETAIKAPFIDLKFQATGGSWGSCTVEVGEVSKNATPADQGFPVKTTFKNSADSFELSEDCIISGIYARGRVTVKVTSLSSVTELKVWVRPAA